MNISVHTLHFYESARAWWYNARQCAIRRKASKTTLQEIVLWKVFILAQNLHNRYKKDTK